GAGVSGGAGNRQPLPGLWPRRSALPAMRDAHRIHPTGAAHDVLLPPMPAAFTGPLTRLRWTFRVDTPAGGRLDAAPFGFTEVRLHPESPNHVPCRAGRPGPLLGLGA